MENTKFVNLSRCKDFNFLKEHLSDEKLTVLENILEAYSAGRIDIKIVRDKDEQIEFDKSFDLLILDPEYQPLTEANGDRAWLEEVAIKWYESFEDTGYLVERVRDFVPAALLPLDEQIESCAKQSGSRELGGSVVDRGAR